MARAVLLIAGTIGRVFHSSAASVGRRAVVGVSINSDASVATSVISTTATGEVDSPSGSEVSGALAQADKIMMIRNKKTIRVLYIQTPVFYLSHLHSRKSIGTMWRAAQVL